MSYAKRKSMQGKCPTRIASTLWQPHLYKSPPSHLGVISDKLFLEKCMQRFLLELTLFIKQVAEREVCR